MAAFVSMKIADSINQCQIQTGNSSVQTLWVPKKCPPKRRKPKENCCSLYVCVVFVCIYTCPT